MAVSLESSQNTPVTLQEPHPENARYTEDMQVEDIVKLMSLEEAQAIVMPVGSCKGMTMEEIAKKRRINLRVYVHGAVPGITNVIRAASRIMLESLGETI